MSPPKLHSAPLNLIAPPLLSYVSTGPAAGLCCPWSDRRAALLSPPRCLWTRRRRAARAPPMHSLSARGPAAASSPGHTPLWRRHTHTHTFRSARCEPDKTEERGSVTYRLSWLWWTRCADLSWAPLVDFGCSFWPAERWEGRGWCAEGFFTRRREVTHEQLNSVFALKSRISHHHETPSLFTDTSHSVQ